MASQDLMEAVRFAKAGKRAEAERQLARILQHDPDNIRAWLCLASSVQDPAQKLDCLTRVLRLDPGNKTATAAMLRLAPLPSREESASPTDEETRKSPPDVSTIVPEASAHVAQMERKSELSDSIKAAKLQSPSLPYSERPTQPTPIHRYTSGPPSSARQTSSGNVVAAIASFVIPGLGQLAQGRLKDAAKLFFAAILLWAVFFGWLVHIWAAIDAASWEG